MRGQRSGDISDVLGESLFDTDCAPDNVHADFFHLTIPLSIGGTGMHMVPTVNLINGEASFGVSGNVELQHSFNQIIQSPAKHLIPMLSSEANHLKCWTLEVSQFLSNSEKEKLFIAALNSPNTDLQTIAIAKAPKSIENFDGFVLKSLQSDNARFQSTAAIRVFDIENKNEFRIAIDLIINNKLMGHRSILCALSIAGERIKNDPESNSKVLAYLNSIKSDADEYKNLKMEIDFILNKIKPSAVDFDQ